MKGSTFYCSSASQTFPQGTYSPCPPEKSQQTPTMICASHMEYNQDSDRPVLNECCSLQGISEACSISNMQGPQLGQTKKSSKITPNIESSSNNSITEEQARHNAEEKITKLFTEIIAKSVRQREFEIEEKERKNELMFSRHRAIHFFKGGRLHDSLCKRRSLYDFEIAKEDFTRQRKNTDKSKAQILIDSLNATSDYIYEYSKALCAMLGSDGCSNEETIASTAAEREFLTKNERHCLTSKTEDAKADQTCNKQKPTSCYEM